MKLVPVHGLLKLLAIFVIRETGEAACGLIGLIRSRLVLSPRKKKEHASPREHSEGLSNSMEKSLSRESASKRARAVEAVFPGDGYRRFPLLEMSN